MFQLYADKNKLSVRQRERLTSGSANVYPVCFEFSADWEGLTCTAVFKSGGQVWSVRLDETSTCVIPREVLCKPWVPLEAGVYGTRDSDTVLPTIWVNLGTILPGAVSGEDAQPPTLELWRQELAGKADALDYDGVNLSLMSGDKLLSTVQICSGESVESVPREPSAEFTTDGTLALSEDKVLSVVNPVKGVSKSEYAGLTAAQKAGLVAALDSEYDTLYLNGRELVPCPITDASDIYSTSETVVGKWIDGKLLYRKVIVLSNVSVTVAARNIATLSYSTLVSLTGMAKNGSIWWSMGGTEYLATSGSNITLSATTGGWSVPTLYIIAVYTK